MTKRPGRSLANDPGFQAVLAAKCDAICLVGKTWEFHVDVALGITLEENLQGITQLGRPRWWKASARRCSIASISSTATRLTPITRSPAPRRAYEAGARWVVLCDTNGGTLPEEIEDIVAEVVKHIPGDRLGIHVHNDTDNGVANSLAAVRAGARQIQGTLNGLGERCGNANLTSIIPTLMLKSDYADALRDRGDAGKAPNADACLAHPR